MTEAAPGAAALAPLADASTRVLVLRHGRTAWNAERRFQGQLDPPLDAVGRMQAHEVSPLIAAYAPVRLVTSDLSRAAETARIIGAYVGVEPTVDARLRERDLGHWQGLTRDQIRERYPAEYGDWLNGRDVRERGGESRAEVRERACAAFADLLPQVPARETLVLVTHGATSLALGESLLGLDSSQHALGPLANCHWSEYASTSDHSIDTFHGWRLRAHNVGVPGVVVPLPALRPDGADEVTDADA